MLAKGSPKFNMMQAACRQKKFSPRSGGVQKKRASPKAAAKVDRQRASWNLGLEKGLVDLLRDHNNDYYRGQNSWSSEAWNRIVKSFQEKFTHVSFTKSQIQEKEKELKREYNLLKEAKKQSGTHWNLTLAMIEADPPIWENIIRSHPKARKFQTKAFPLFDALGQLYDGHTAEGSFNFTSIPPTPSEPPNITQLSDSEGLEVDDYHSAPSFTQHVPLDDDDEDGGDDEVRIVQKEDQRCPATTSSRLTAPRKAKEPTDPNGGKKVGKKQKQEHVAGMMQKYLEVRTKQVEEEVAEKTKAAAEVDDFSIKNCIGLVNTIEGLSGEEKAETFDVFKDAQNREIFMAAEPISRLIWLKKKLGTYQSQQ